MTLKLTMRICVLLSMSSPAAFAKVSVSSRSDLKDRQEEVVQDIKKIRASLEKKSCDDADDSNKECAALNAKLDKDQDELLSLQDKLDSMEKPRQRSSDSALSLANDDDSSLDDGKTGSQGRVCLACEAARNGGLSNKDSNTTELLNSMAQMLAAMRMEIAALKYQSGMSQQMNLGANTNMMYGQNTGMNMNLGNNMNMNQSMMMPAGTMNNMSGGTSAMNYLSAMMMPNLANSYASNYNTNYGNSIYGTGNMYGYGYGNNSYLRPPLPQNRGYNTGYGAYYGSQGTTATSTMIPAR